MLCEKAKQVYACGRGECKIREKAKNYDVNVFIYKGQFGNKDFDNFQSPCYQTAIYK